jgi:hypothetical protein
MRVIPGWQYFSMNQVRLVQLGVVDGVLVLGTEINHLLPALGRLSRGGHHSCDHEEMRIEKKTLSPCQCQTKHWLTGAYADVTFPPLDGRVYTERALVAIKHGLNRGSEQLRQGMILRLRTDPHTFEKCHRL